MNASAIGRSTSSVIAAPPPTRRRSALARRQLVLDLADGVLDALHERPAGGARLARSLAAVVRREQQRVRGGDRAAVVGERLGLRDVPDLLVTDERRALRPPALAGGAGRGEAVEGAGVLAVLLVGARVLDAVGEAVLDELLDAQQPLLLVPGVAGEVELEHLLDARVVGHPVDPGGLQPALRLGGDVAAEVRSEERR